LGHVGSPSPVEDQSEQVAFVHGGRSENRGG
jgi:hypothetical protein